MAVDPSQTLVLRRSVPASLGHKLGEVLGVSEGSDPTGAGASVLNSRIWPFETTNRYQDAEAAVVETGPATLYATL